MTNIQAKIEKLFEFEKTLHLLLDAEQYEQFSQRQDLFGDLLKDLLKKHSASELNNIIEDLQRLRNRMSSLQARATIQTEKLKERSLLLQRNKNKIKAYK